MNKNHKQEIIRFIKFNIIGVLNTSVDFLVFTCLTAVFMVTPIPAQIVSYSCGIINSYVWNRFWTFKGRSKKSSREFLIFIVVNLLILGISTAMIYYINQFIENIYIVKLIVTGFVMVLNFLAQRLIIFKDIREQVTTMGNLEESDY